MPIRAILSLLNTTFTKWSDDDVPRFGASLAFYTLFSLAPLLILFIAIVAAALGESQAQYRVLEEVHRLMGGEGRQLVATLLKNVHEPGSGAVAGSVGIVTLLFGASGVCVDLRDALNVVWGAKLDGTHGSWWMRLAKQRLFSFAMVFSIGFLLLVSLILSTALATTVKFFSYLIPFPPFVVVAVNFLMSFVTVTCLFALIFRYVPDVHSDWKDIWVGALVTSFLFTAGKVLLGLYLGVTSVGSAYGAAGSLVAVVIWVYYSSQIFLFGAEFTRVYSDVRHSVERGPYSENPESA